MAARRSPRELSEPTQNVADVIEILSSDSEPEAPEVDDEAPESAPDSEHVHEQPLLRAAGIKYKTDQPEDDEQDEQHSPSSAKLAVRTRDTGSAKHRHVSIEIPLPTSSELRRRKGDSSVSGSQEGNDEEVFKTPNERQHITFDDSDHDEFVTPREGPSRDPLESTVSRPTGKDDEEEESEEDSDDEAPPEAVSTRVAEAETLKAAGAAAKAAKQHATAKKEKRQEQAAFLQRQAEERKRTRKPKRQEDEEEDVTASTQGPAPATEKRKREVTKLLPLELLESDDEDDVPQQPSSAADKHKRRKLGSAEQALLRGPKLPKDKRLGSTAYRVVKGTGDARLAPSVKKQAVNLRESLLRRERVPQSRGGFFVKSR